VAKFGHLTRQHKPLFKRLRLRIGVDEAGFSARSDLAGKLYLVTHVVRFGMSASESQARACLP
jgi:hypothetical protein